MSSSSRNYFDVTWLAPRYAASRPDVHSRIAEQIRQTLKLRARIDHAVDVGAGTGLSTRCLRPLARFVVGLDPSAAMLAEARRAGGAAFARARGEALPVAGASIDLVTIGCAYHWCDTEAFLAEAARILRSGGWLVVYDNHFFGQTPRSSELSDWLVAEHWAQLPRAPRNRMPDPATFSHDSFDLVGTDFVEEWISMTREALVTYLTTQSGASASIESGAETLEELENRLREGVSRFVPEGPSTFRFAGPVHYLRRLPDTAPAS
jgi:SAM-dependent methyltransferase